MLLYTPDPNGSLEPPSDSFFQGTRIELYIRVYILGWHVYLVTFVYVKYMLLNIMQEILMNSMFHGFVEDILYSMLEICQLRQAKAWVSCWIS